MVGHEVHNFTQSEQIGANRKKTEQIGTKPNKLEQIPFCWSDLLQFCARNSKTQCQTFFSQRESAEMLETGIGGVKSPKIRGENFEFPGVPEIDPCLQIFYRKSQFGGQKSKSSRGNFRGEFPPLAFGTF